VSPASFLKANPSTAMRFMHTSNLYVYLHTYEYRYGGYNYTQTVSSDSYIQRAHEHTRTWSWSESGFECLKGAPLDISRCLEGRSQRRDPMAGLRAGPPSVLTGDSRVSPVSFLKANPRTAMRFPETVLNMDETIEVAKRRFW